MYLNIKMLLEPLLNNEDVYFVLLNDKIIEQRLNLPETPRLSDLSRFFIMGRAAHSGKACYNDKSDSVEIEWGTPGEGVYVGGFVGVLKSSGEVMAFHYLTRSINCGAGDHIVWAVTLSNF